MTSECPLLYGLKLKGKWYVCYDIAVVNGIDSKIAGGPYETRQDMLDGMKTISANWK